MSVTLGLTSNNSSDCTTLNYVDTTIYPANTNQANIVNRNLAIYDCSGALITTGQKSEIICVTIPILPIIGQTFTITYAGVAYTYTTVATDIVALGPNVNVATQLLLTGQNIGTGLFNILNAAIPNDPYISFCNYTCNAGCVLQFTSDIPGYQITNLTFSSSVGGGIISAITQKSVPNWNFKNTYTWNFTGYVTPIIVCNISIDGYNILTAPLTSALTGLQNQLNDIVTQFNLIYSALYDTLTFTSATNTISVTTRNNYSNFSGTANSVAFTSIPSVVLNYVAAVDSIFAQPITQDCVYRSYFTEIEVIPSYTFNVLTLSAGTGSPISTYSVSISGIESVVVTTNYSSSLAFTANQLATNFNNYLVNEALISPRDVYASVTGTQVTFYVRLGYLTKLGLTQASISLVATTTNSGAYTGYSSTFSSVQPAVTNTYTTEFDILSLCVANCLFGQLVYTESTKPGSDGTCLPLSSRFLDLIEATENAMCNNRIKDAQNIVLKLNSIYPYNNNTATSNCGC